MLSGDFKKPNCQQGMPAVSFSQMQPPITPDEEKYRREMAAYVEKLRIDTGNYYEKQRLAFENRQMLIVFQKNVQLAAEMCTDDIIIKEDGRIVKRKGFLYEESRDYIFTNFKLTGKPQKLITKTNHDALLLLRVRTDEQMEMSLYLDMNMTKAGYFWKKFRDAGLVLKKRRGETGEVIFSVINALVKCAEYVEIPEKNGFYHDSQGRWHYADAFDLTWEEAMKLAR